MFHLDYKPVPSPWQITHTDNLFSVGSCFADNMATYLKDRKFKVTDNPHGILFNPMSIAKTLTAILNKHEADEEDIITHDGLWFSFHHHSKLYGKEKLPFLKQLQTINAIHHDALKQANVLFITFGSAYGYRHLERNVFVANCQKQSADLFQKELINKKMIVAVWKNLVGDLQEHIPDLKIIFTVSPVKYLRDGLHENNLSKATLLLSVHELVSELANCFYFPAFELVNDDLRDYRFYKTDMAHPNEQALDYVWQRFSETYFSEKTIALNRQLEKLQQAMQHRFLQEESESVLTFKAATKQLINTIKQQHSYLNFQIEETMFS
jgi:hypothetical protein